MTKSKKALWH